MNFYGFMNYSLIKKGYMTIEEVPMEELVDTISLYLKEKTKEESNDVFMLFKVYVSKNPDEQELATIIHYLLNYISIMQEFAVVWEINQSETPNFTYNKYNTDKIDALNTTQKIPYEETFELVLNKSLELKTEREEGIRR